MKVMSSLRDSDPLSDSFGAQESCQEKVSRCAPLTTFKKLLTCHMYSTAA